MRDGENKGAVGVDTYLPTNNVGMLVEQTWKMAPKTKTPTDAMSDFRRPKRSPTGAASRAPMTVPTLRMEMMMACWLTGSAGGRASGVRTIVLLPENW